MMKVGTISQKNQALNGEQQDREQQAPADGASHGERRSIADRLLELLEELELARDASGNAYALPIVGGVRQVLEVRSRQFREYVRLQGFAAFHRSINGETLTQVVETIAARATFQAPLREISMRVASDDRTIWLDLGDERWRAVHITADGWRIVDRAGALIARARDCLPLPEPARARESALEQVFDLFRLTPRERTLVRIWLLAALRGRRPFPILAIVGEAGAGKSTFANFLLALVDPTKAGLRAPPREHRDLVAAARNSYVVALENISHINQDLADCLCRLATGAGIGGRALYTDHDEATFYAARPVLLNGIPDVPERPDLLDRTLIVTLRGVPDAQRLLDEDLHERLEALRPAALAELLDAISRGLARWPRLKAALRQKPRRLPRLADPALWAEACGVADAVDAMLAAREEGLAEVAEADAFALAIRKLVAEHGGIWEGTGADLLRAVASAEQPPNWPKTAKAATDRVRRLAPALRAVGLEVEPTRSGPTRARGMRFCRRQKGDTICPICPEGEISQANQWLRGGQIAQTNLPASARICPDLPADLPASARICPHLPWLNQLNTNEKLVSSCAAGRSGRFFPDFTNGRIAELVEALAHGDLARARPLFERTFGRAPIGRELGDLAMLDSREKIARALEALAPLEA